MRKIKLANGEWEELSLRKKLENMLTNDDVLVTTPLLDDLQYVFKSEIKEMSWLEIIKMKVF